MKRAIAMAMLTVASTAAAQHVPPDPPQHLLPHQSYEQMVEMMRMDDTERYGRVIVDQLEWQDDPDHADITWDAQAYYGGDYHKLWLKAEGVHEQHADDARIEALWNRIVSPWWSTQCRHDFGDGPSRTWLALGVEGLAPQWFDVEAAIYVGEESRTALRVDVSYDLLLTQRLVLQPQLEADVRQRRSRASHRLRPVRYRGRTAAALRNTPRVRAARRHTLGPAFRRDRRSGG